MNLNQFFITFCVALIVGVILSNIAKIVFTHFMKFYRKLTFRHVLLKPYKPSIKKKDKT